MEMKRRECERETKEEGHKEDSIHTIVFTAGTFLLMVCLKHFLVEQWRAWVFLILNIILLAILFMSMKPSYFERSLKSEGNVEEAKSDNKEKQRPNECSQEIEGHKKQCWTSSSNSSSTHVHVDVENETEEDDEEEEEQVPMLSNEELNERVEAFIAMFRQHLISDVNEAENFGLHKIQVPCC